MWTWLAALPLGLQITIILIIIGAIVGVSVFGRFVFKGGLTSFTLGGDRKRSCGDCVLIMMGKRELAESKQEYISRNVLKDQMNFVEQKTVEVQTHLLNSYLEDLKAKRGTSTDPAEENKQYRLYQNTLKCALQLMKDEIRRSFKENGFDHLGGIEFSNYVKDKVQSLVSMVKSFMVDQYPYERMIVKIEDRFIKLESYIPKLEDIGFEVFQKAKDIRRNAESNVTKIHEDFAREINEFIGV